MTTARTGRGNGKPDEEQLVDLRAAARAEAAAAPFRFRYPVGDDYVTLEVPPQRRWPIKAIMLLEEEDPAKQKVVEAFRMLLGEEPFWRLADLGLDLGEMMTLMRLIAEASGMSLPNGSPPSPPASTRT